MSNADGNGEHGVAHHKCTVLQLVYDHETCQVSLGANHVPVALAQMMVHEAHLQLAEIRRIAAAQQLLEQQRNAAQAQAIADSLRKR